MGECKQSLVKEGESKYVEHRTVKEYHNEGKHIYLVRILINVGYVYKKSDLNVNTESFLPQPPLLLPSPDLIPTQSYRYLHPENSRYDTSRRVFIVTKE